MRLILVKNAAPGYWEHYFDRDPQEGVHASYNATFTYSGKAVGLPMDPFHSQEEATPWLKKLQALNISGGYAICPVLED